MYINEYSRAHRNFLDEFCGPYIRRHIQQSHMFIAGGSLVSFKDNQLPPRDIDIYVPLYEPEQFKRKLHSEAGSEYLFLNHADTERYSGLSRNYLYLKYLGLRGKETGIQMMFWPLCDPINTICGYDIEICKIALIGNVILQGRCFQNDFENKVINLGMVTNSERTLGRIHKYIERGYRPSEATLGFMRTAERTSSHVEPPIAPSTRTARVRLDVLEERDLPVTFQGNEPVWERREDS